MKYVLDNLVTRKEGRGQEDGDGCKRLAKYGVV